MAKVNNNCEPRHVDAMFYEDDPNRQCAFPNGAIFPFYIPSFYDSFQAFGGFMLNPLSVLTSPRSTNLASFVLAVTVLFSLSGTSVAQHTSPNMQLPCSEAATSNGTPGMTTACGPVGGGGGGGGGGSNIPSPVLNWSSPYEDSNFETENAQYIGVGATNWNNQVWIAPITGSGYVQLMHSPPGTGLGYSDLGIAYGGSIPQLGQTYASASLAVDALGALNIGFIDGGNNELVIYRTQDAHTFNRSYCANTTGGGTPSIVEFNGYIYAFFNAPNNYGMVSCRFDTNGNVQVQTYPNYQLGSAPSAAVYNGTLYIAYKSNDSNNLLDLLTSTDGSTFNFSSAAQGSHTSTAPSVATHNGYLYIGFRQNDPNSHAFFYTYSTNGSTFANPILVNWSIGGPPSLVEDSNKVLHNVFRQNDNLSYLFTADSN